ncbi:MAG TPA: outer membrane protein assembly factor BamA [Chthoniobacterales bacterium]|nr:outer membrane protein assembly factor BamA [Chthoniobacterales bacterium]
MKEFIGLTRGGISVARLALMLILAVASSVSSRAQTAPQQQGPPLIRSIDIQYVGPQTIAREKVLAQMQSKPGKPYSESLVEQDIKALYRTSQVQNVRIFGQPEGDGVKVIVVLQTRSFVNEIDIEGAERINAKKLRKAIALKINGPLSEDELQKAREKIVETYQAKGFTDVDVKYKVETDEAHGTSKVVFTITEGTKGAISAIRFEGNTKFPDKVLRKQMKTKGKTLYSFIDKSGRLDETQLEQDVNAVKEYYQDHGYIDVEVKEVRRERAKGHMTVVVVLIEGPLYRVGKIQITGTKATTQQKVRALLKMKEGGVYSPKQIREDSKTIADAYGSGGYVDLQVIPQGVPAGDGRIDVHYQIEEGGPSFVQRINIVGNTRTKDKVIRREVLIAPGDIMNSVRVETTKKRLDNLGYFEKVETYPEDTGVAGRKDLTIQVQEKRTGSLNFGAGFSTIDQLVGFVEMSQGNFDILNWPTFTGAGQKFRFRIQYGNTRKDITLSLTEPYFLDRRLSLGGELFFREADYLSNIYTQRNYGFSIETRKAITAFTAVSLQYRIEAIELFDVAAGASSQILREQGETTKSQITLGIANDTRDNPFLTRRGHRLVFTPYFAGGFLGGSEQIVGFSLEGRQYFHMWKDSILLFSGSVAAVDSWGDGTRVRIYDRLFLGGSNDLRGFNYRDVSPRDINGEPLGGQSLASFTAEYTMPIIEKARFAIFYDTGFVNAKPWDYDTSHLVSDFGIGLRLDLPIGPLRIDYGIPLEKNGYKDAGSGKFNFNVGYQF